MKLRTKTILIVSLTLVSLVGVLFATSSLILIRSLRQAEVENTRQTVKGVLNILDQTTEDFSNRFDDWSAWDDTYNFIKKPNKEYIESNLVEEQLASLRVNLVLFLNLSGNLVFGTSVDLSTKELKPVPDDIKPYLSLNNLLLQHDQPSSRRDGILMLSGGPMLITSQPIVTSKGAGPIEGTVIFGRYLNQTQLERLRRITRLSLEIYSLNDPQISPEIASIRGKLVEEQAGFDKEQNKVDRNDVLLAGKDGNSSPIVVRPVNTQIIAGYTLIRDIYGEPALILRVDLPREIYKQGEISQRYLVTSLLLVGFGFGGCTVILLERLVLSKLADVSANVTRIGKRKDLSMRLPIKGNDELSSLANTINEMLAALETSQKERRETQERYRAVVEQSSEGIFLFDVDTKRIIEANKTLEKLLGYSSNSLLGISIYEILGEGKNSIAQITAILDPQIIQIGERQYRRKDGSLIICEVSANIIWYEGRKAVCAVVRDITERKKAEAALQESEKRLRRQNEVLVSLAKSRSLSEGDVQGYCRNLTEAAAKVLEIDRASVWLYNEERSVLYCLDLYEPKTKRHSCGNKLAAVDHPFYFKALEQERILVVKDVYVDPRTSEFRSSYMRPLQVRALLDAPIRIAGEIVGVVCHEHSGNSRNWTQDEQNFACSIADLVALSLEARERQKTQEALRQTEEKYRMIFENAVEGIFQSTTEGKYLSANLALARLYGYSSPQELMENVTDINRQLYVEPNRRAEFVEAMESAGAVWQFESQVYRQDGSVIWISENARVVRDNQGQILYYEGTVEDISTRKVMQEALRYQQEQAERLLLNILPAPIAERLKLEPDTIAESFSEVTVLFADLVGFTQLAEEMSPKDLVNLLNKIFSAFDRLAEQHNLEKIKTIGDAYMVVGGIPTHRSDHAEAIADMALDMQQELIAFNEATGHNITMRSGIHTGPVIAGVIGIKKFIYDLWGDTVNIASRMESHGIPGTIQVSRVTYEKLSHKYLFKEREAIYVKGKGKMVTYLLIGRR
ncbi:PAS domain S-box protein [Ancylothrix sp. C2]|uniref:adenylate/guanylate cyclase domain-containing protein n=1 Tax=Ancylothrix sp. D3o TaxID=2953691 RepID=UPI0021BB65C2|nr:adenylate/guanylate cyclase domain-containing protein [Ancylothrix sp. D3o]MCT7948323.1 PAS domain S-box protein [Ancylothrix sp. D3o]